MLRRHHKHVSSPGKVLFHILLVTRSPLGLRTPPGPGPCSLSVSFRAWAYIITPSWNPPAIRLYWRREILIVRPGHGSEAAGWFCSVQSKYWLTGSCRTRQPSSAQFSLNSRNLKVHECLVPESLWWWSWTCSVHPPSDSQQTEDTPGSEAPGRSGPSHSDRQTGNT